MISLGKEEYATLVAEACEICNRQINLRMKKSDIKPSITGVSTVLDIHGLEDNPPHARILYVDERMSVRSFSTVTAIANEKK